MTKLKQIRMARKLRLREVAARLNIRIQAVGNMEKQGIKTPKKAVFYAKAFPGISWRDLLEEPQV